MGRKRMRGLKARVGQECCISRERASLNSGGIQAGGVPGESHSVIRRSRDTIRRAAPGVRAAKSSEYRKGE